MHFYHRSHGRGRFAALLLVSAVLLFSCRKVPDIVILYTNDVHAAVSEDQFGFAELAAYKQKILKKTPCVVTVDAGDAIQGTAVAVLSKGRAAVAAMNAAGYDFAVYGNHEFDYGVENLNSLVELADTQYVCCNVSCPEYGDAQPDFLARALPFALKNFGGRSVAFIGVTTPDTVNLATVPPAYDFSGGEDGARLCRAVQAAVDASRAAGADYVVLLAHLGATDGMYSSYAVAARTYGIDVIIDGHSHTVMQDEVRQNSRGQPVHITSTGARFQHFGSLTISSGGRYRFRLISRFPRKDPAVAAALAAVVRDADAFLSRGAAESDMQLSLLDENGQRLATRQESVLGDVCADAFRTAGNADIAFLNGAGIRAGLPQGTVSYGDLLALFPFGNTLCVISASGQQILDALEWSCRELPLATNGFLQVSGISFEADTQVPSPVRAGEDAAFLSCEGQRRVGNVRVLLDGKWQELECGRMYSLAGSTFLLRSGGDGYTMFRDCELLRELPYTDADALAAYLNITLQGKLAGNYAAQESRIGIVPVSK